MSKFELQTKTTTGPALTPSDIAAPVQADSLREAAQLNNYLATTPVTGGILKENIPPQPNISGEVTVTATANSFPLSTQTYTGTGAQPHFGSESAAWERRNEYANTASGTLAAYGISGQLLEPGPKPGGWLPEERRIKGMLELSDLIANSTGAGVASQIEKNFNAEASYAYIAKSESAAGKLHNPGNEVELSTGGTETSSSAPRTSSSSYTADPRNASENPPARNFVNPYPHTPNPGTPSPGFDPESARLDMLAALTATNHVVSRRVDYDLIATIERVDAEDKYKITFSKGGVDDLLKFGIDASGAISELRSIYNELTGNSDEQRIKLYPQIERDAQIYKFVDDVLRHLSTHPE